MNMHNFLLKINLRLHMPLIKKDQKLWWDATFPQHCNFCKEIYYLFNFGYNFSMPWLLPAIAFIFIDREQINKLNRNEQLNTIFDWEKKHEDTRWLHRKIADRCASLMWHAAVF